MTTRRTDTLALLVRATYGQRHRHQDTRDLPDGTLLEVVNCIGDRDGGTRDGFDLPGHFLVRASGGPLPYPVVLEAVAVNGRPRCVRYIVDTADDGEPITATRVRDHLPVDRLLREALPVVMRQYDHDALPADLRGSDVAAALLLRPGRPGEATTRRARRGDSSDEWLTEVADTYRRARALHGHRKGVGKAREALGNLPKNTMHRLMVEAYSRGHLKAADWPEHGSSTDSSRTTGKATSKATSKVTKRHTTTKGEDR